MPDEERDLWLGDWERSMKECPHCRGSREDCADSDKVWHMHKSVCHKTAALEASRRIHAAEYQDAEWHDGTFKHWFKEFAPPTEDSPGAPFHYMDGVSIWVAEEPQSASPHAS